MQGTEEQRASSDRQADSRRIQVKYKGLLGKTDFRNINEYLVISSTTTKIPTFE